MSIKEIYNRLKKDPKDAWYYIQGNVRLFVFRRNAFKFLIRKHIAEQYLWRRDIAARDCFLNGQCKCCECETPALFFSEKGCSVDKIQRCVIRGLKKCYPALMDKKEWTEFNKNL